MRQSQSLFCSVVIIIFIQLQYMAQADSKYTLRQTLQSDRKLDKDQLKQIEEVQQYLAKNKIDALFNELIVGLVTRRPDDISTDLLSTLKKLKKGEKFFSKADFETMFDNYDFFEKGEKGGQEVHYKAILQALENINIKMTHEVFLQKYPQFKLGKYVKKDDFVGIMDKEYAQHTAFT